MTLLTGLITAIDLRATCVNLQLEFSKNDHINKKLLMGNGRYVTGRHAASHSLSLGQHLNRPTAGNVEPG